MIDEQEINDSLKASFDEADINKDGFLNVKELIPVLEQSEEGVLKYIKKSDLNNDLQVSLDEFKSSYHYYLGYEKMQADLAAEAAQEAADAQADPSITPSTPSDSTEAPQSLFVKPQITWNCTYRCSVYNMCMV